MLDFLNKKRELQCTAEKDDNIITQPDLSRTIRQILKDTVEGKPSPQALQPLPYDSQRFNGEKVDNDKLHALRVINDKFEAIDASREAVKSAEFARSKAEMNERNAIKSLQRERQQRKKEEKVEEKPQPEA